MPPKSDIEMTVAFLVLAQLEISICQIFKRQLTGYSTITCMHREVMHAFIFTYSKFKTKNSSILKWMKRIRCSLVTMGYLLLLT